MFSRWRACHAELHGETLSLYEEHVATPLYSLEVNNASVTPVVDDPLKFIIRSGDTVLHLRAESTTERVLWMRALLKGREEAIDRSIKSMELHNRTNSNGWSSSVAAVRQLLDEINRYRHELSDQVKALLPLLNRDGSETGAKIVQAADDLNRTLIELARIVEQPPTVISAPSIATARSNDTSPIKSLTALHYEQEHNSRAGTGSRNKVNQPSVQREESIYEEQFQDIKEMNNLNESLSNYHSFIDQGYDGLTDVHANSDWRYGRADSFQHNREHVPSASTAILKRVKIGCIQKLLSQNRVYQILPNILSNSSVRHGLPQPATRQQQINILGVIKGVIGQDIFSLNLPIATNEPISTLQKLAEQFIYEDLLVKANAEEDSSKRLLLVLAFAISGYSTQVNRAKLPLKPLIGETFELADQRFQYVSEQVNRHTSAFHCESTSYVVEGSLQYDTRFTGKAIESTPKGSVFVFLKRPKLLVSFVRCATRVTNLVFGEAQMNISGEMTLNDERNDIGFAKLKGKSSLFAQHGRNEVEGWLKHAGAIRYVIDGKYDEFLDAFEMRTKLKTRIWQMKHRQRPQFYNFTDYTIQLNNLTHELFERIPTTDARLRPDLRALENGMIELAEFQRQRLYGKQKELEHLNPPLWFVRATHPLTGQLYFQTNNRYWPSRQYGSWQRCKDIF